MPIPNSLPWMESVDAKIARAHEHLGALDDEIAAFLKATKRTFVLKSNQAQTEHWIVYWVNDPYPPMRISTLIGDCVFNMRSALDNLVCGLIRTKDSTAKCVGTKFPIYLEEDDYLRDVQKINGSLEGVPGEARVIIKRLQPYQRPEGTRRLDPLFVLNTLSNRDKHRAAILTCGYSKNTRLVVHGHDGVQYRVQLTKPLHSYSPEIIPLNLPVGAFADDDSVRVEAMGSGVVAFRDEGPWSERPAGEVLVACLKHIEDRVIRPLQPFFVQSATTG